MGVLEFDGEAEDGWIVLGACLLHYKRKKHDKWEKLKIRFNGNKKKGVLINVHVPTASLRATKKKAGNGR